MLQRSDVRMLYGIDECGRRIREHDEAEMWSSNHMCVSGRCDDLDTRRSLTSSQEGGDCKSTGPGPAV